VSEVARKLAGRPVIVLALLLIAGCASRSNEQRILMDLIEKTIVLPSGAAPIARYERFYSWDEQSGATVVGEYELSGHAGRKWVAAKDMPITMDGGCGVITFVYNVGLKRFIHVGCNGDA
jgi:hypothetical protein